MEAGEELEQQQQDAGEPPAPAMSPGTAPGSPRALLSLAQGGVWVSGGPVVALFCWWQGDRVTEGPCQLCPPSLWGHRGVTPAGPGLAEGTGHPWGHPCWGQRWSTEGWELPGPCPCSWAFPGPKGGSGFGLAGSWWLLLAQPGAVTRFLALPPSVTEAPGSPALIKERINEPPFVYLHLKISEDAPGSAQGGTARPCNGSLMRGDELVLAGRRLKNAFIAE